MIKLLKPFLLLSIPLLFIGCARIEAPKLPANYFYEGSAMHIHSPNSEAWSKIYESDSQMIFGKKGPLTGESYVAQVILFPLAVTNSEEEFLTLVKNEVSKSSNEERFDVLQSSFKPSNIRDYSCVMAKTLYKDNMAKTSAHTTEKLLLQIKSLYCKNPMQEGMGFMVGYSFRGQSIHKNFDLEAHSFIDGVELPGY